MLYKRPRLHGRGSTCCSQGRRRPRDGPASSVSTGSSFVHFWTMERNDHGLIIIEIRRRTPVARRGLCRSQEKSVHLRTSCVESSVLDIGTLSGRSTTSRDPSSYIRPGVALSSSTSSARSGALSLLCPTRIRHRSRASRFVSICSRPAKIWSATSLAGRPSRRRSTRHRHIKRRLTASSLRARARRSPDRRCSLRLRRKSMKSDV